MAPQRHIIYTLTASEMNVRCMRNADGLSGYLTNWPMSA